MVYLVYAGFAKRSDRRAALAAAVVGGESVLFAANGFRCPLTDVAESLGADDGSVTDIFLPRWFAHSLPAIHVPLILLTAYLHGRNLRRGGPRRRSRRHPRSISRLASRLQHRPLRNVSTASASCCENRCVHGSKRITRVRE
jgi:hypothetical protein